jgi:outer membrane protein assembly factor BamB
MKKPVLLLFIILVLVAASCAPPGLNEPVVSVAPTAAATDAVYIADSLGRVRAFNLDGKEQWSISVADEISRLNGRASRDIQIEYLVAEQNGKLFGLAGQLSGERTGQSYLFALAGNRIAWQLRREDFVYLYPALKRRAKFIRHYASKTLNQRSYSFNSRRC